MTCTRGNHITPRTGGSCSCGLVTFVPAPAKPARPCLACGFDPATEIAWGPDGPIIDPSGSTP